MSSIESILYWATALMLAVGFFTALLSMIYKKRGAFDIGRAAVALAFVLITIFGIIRWVEWNHPPFVTLFESMVTSIWFVLLFFLVSQLFSSKVSIILLPVSLISFLMMGWSSSLPQEATVLSAALTNTWLFIHASFATSGAAAFLIAASFALIYLLGEKKLESAKNIIAAIPAHNKIVPIIQKTVIFGLILWGVMIVSGSIWANIAWGRYWGWDPIELWSLISWLLYGLLLHARITFKIKPSVFCTLTIIAALVVAFALWGVNYIYQTIHTYG